MIGRQLLMVGPALALASAASSQESGGASAVDVLAAACAGTGAHELNRHRLAEFVIQKSTGSVVDALNDSRVATMADNRSKLLRLVQLQTSTSPVGKDLAIRETISNLERFLARKEGFGNEPVVLLNPSVLTDEAQPGWLFAEGSQLKMRCTKKSGGDIPAIAPVEFKPPVKPAIALRSKPEEFAADPEARKTAGAANIGYEKVWDRDVTTELRSKETVTVNGALGIRLTPTTDPSTAYTFVRYDHKKVRADPLADLAEGERRDKDDTNVLEIGGMVDMELSENDAPFKVFALATAGYVFNFVEDSERLRLRTLLEFLHPDFDLPVCGFGKPVPLGVGSLQGRCLANIDVQAGIETREARNGPGDYTDYFGVGGNFTYELFSTLSAKQQIIATANARYVPVIAGKGPDIWQIEMTAKQRYWVNDDIGIDLGVTFFDGRNQLTLKEEKRLTVGLGLIL